MTPTAMWKADLEARKNRWREFLKPGAKPGFMFRIMYADRRQPALPPAPPHWPDKAAERVEYKWKAYQRALERATAVQDDGLPSLNMLTGTEIFAEAFGCKVHRPGDNQPFALPMVHSAPEVAKVRVPELSTSSLAYLFDMADELQRRAGPGALMQMVDVQSPMDIAALIWEKESFCVGMLEEPGAVKELAAKVAQLLTAFLDEWFKRYGREFVAHFPDYFMPGGLTLSEDEIGIVSPEAFREFFLPELAALSKRYGGIGIHCCADARHQWENLRALPGLRLLNLCNPPVRKPEEYCGAAYPFFAGTCAQMHYGWNPPGPPEQWPAGYPPGCRVVFDVYAESEAEAARLAEKFQLLRAG